MMDIIQKKFVWLIGETWQVIGGILTDFGAGNFVSLEH